MKVASTKNGVVWRWPEGGDRSRTINPFLLVVRELGFGIEETEDLHLDC